MSTVNVAHKTGERIKLPLDDYRGVMGMWLVIATETCLFVALFAAYFLIGNNKDRWNINQPPHMTYPLIMLGVMVFSCFIMGWGDSLVNQKRFGAARIVLACVFICGLVFLALQSVSLTEHWAALAPYSDSYGSIYYVIAIGHAAHVVVGLLIFIFVLCQPSYGPVTRSPYRVYHVSALYWYWVTTILFFVVVILTVIPNGIVYVH